MNYSFFLLLLLLLAFLFILRRLVDYNFIVKSRGISELMARMSKLMQKPCSRGVRVASKNVHSSHQKIPDGIYGRTERKLWEAARCSVCMESPHNAVLLLCSSYHKGCRPYMCATSHRFSNCLDQYKKAYTKVTAIQNAHRGSMNASKPGAGLSDGEVEVTEILCPLCRGEVKGWTVVEAARDHLNSKKRPCMHDKCCYVGNYRQLRRHVRAHHGSAKPLQVDPLLEAKWKRLESERDRDDVISTITSTMPGAIVMGDYVIERNYGDMYSDDYSDLDLDSDSDTDISPFASDHGGLFVFRRRAFGSRRVSDGQHNALAFPRHRRFVAERPRMRLWHRGGARSRGLRDEWDL